MDKDLQKYMQSVLDEYLDELALVIQEKLKEHIWDYIYEPMEPTTYERTYQFYDSWVTDLSTKLTKRILHDSSVLKYNANKYQHGGSHIDRTGMMADILNDNGLNGRNSEFGGALNVEFHEQGYWDAFLDKIEKEFPRWCEEAMATLPYKLARG